LGDLVSSFSPLSRVDALSKIGNDRERRLMCDRATRTAGSVIGFYAIYGWNWYFWREAHEYFMSPFGMFLWVTSLICDLVYPFVLWKVQKTEVVLVDGRKVAAHSVEARGARKMD
jgi:hypothetical protein